MREKGVLVWGIIFTLLLSVSALCASGPVVHFEQRHGFSQFK